MLAIVSLNFSLTKRLQALKVYVPDTKTVLDNILVSTITLKNKQKIILTGETVRPGIENVAFTPTGMVRVIETASLVPLH